MRLYAGLLGGRSRQQPRVHRVLARLLQRRRHHVLPVRCGHLQSVAGQRLRGLPGQQRQCWSGCHLHLQRWILHDWLGQHPQLPRLWQQYVQPRGRTELHTLPVQLGQRIGVGVVRVHCWLLDYWQRQHPSVHRYEEKGKAANRLTGAAGTPSDGARGDGGGGHAVLVAARGIASTGCTAGQFSADGDVQWYADRAFFVAVLGSQQ